jgi:hypothetical protein
VTSIEAATSARLCRASGSRGHHRRNRRSKNQAANAASAKPTSAIVVIGIHIDRRDLVAQFGCQAQRRLVVIIDF